MQYHNLRVGLYPQQRQQQQRQQQGARVDSKSEIFDEDDDDKDDVELQRVLWESQNANRGPVPRVSAVQVLRHIMDTEPGFAQITSPANKPVHYNHQIIQLQGWRKQKDSERIPPSSFSRISIAPKEFTISYKPTSHDSAIPQLLDLTKSRPLEKLSVILTTNTRPNQTMYVAWCDPRGPGGRWLNMNGNTNTNTNTEAEEHETALFTCSSIFPRCLPNELAYRLPLPETDALYIANLKLFRVRETDPLPSAEEKHTRALFSACLLPWHDTNTDAAGQQEGDNTRGHILANQVGLALQMAYIQNAEDIVFCLDPWAKAGRAPVEIAQRFLQALNKFSSQHPRNILFLQQKLRVTVSIRPDLFSIWSMSFQSVFNSDARQKEETKIQTAAQNAPASLNNNNNNNDMRTMDAAKRLLEAEQRRKRFQQNRERQLYLRREVATTDAKQQQQQQQQDIKSKSSASSQIRQQQQQRQQNDLKTHETKLVHDGQRDRKTKHYAKSTVSSLQKLNQRHRKH